MGHEDPSQSFAAAGAPTTSPQETPREGGAKAQAASDSRHSASHTNGHANGGSTNPPSTAHKTASAGQSAPSRTSSSPPPTNPLAAQPIAGYSWDGEKEREPLLDGTRNGSVHSGGGGLGSDGESEGHDGREEGVGGMGRRGERDLDGALLAEEFLRRELAMVPKRLLLRNREFWYRVCNVLAR